MLKLRRAGKAQKRLERLTGRQGALPSAQYEMVFTPLEIIPRCFAVAPVAELHSRIIPAGPNAPLGFEPFDSAHGPEYVEGSQRLEFLTGWTFPGSTSVLGVSIFQSRSHSLCQFTPLEIMPRSPALYTMRCRALQRGWVL